MVGFPQKEITPQLERFIGTYKPGSFLLFKRNITSIEQVRKLNSALYRTSFKHMQLPPFIAIDQEGGTVSRLPIAPAPPSALAIGQTQSPLLAENMGLETGRFLREVGFNMNLAPVLDISDPFATSFIGVRSFGSDPQMVADLSVAFSRGLLRAHVIPTAKHFPGTGSLAGDPHHQVVQNNSSLETLTNIDLRPYREYVKLGDRVAVMLSHLIYPALDNSGEPASFSKKISTDLLRDQLNYKGLVITDDLQMQGSKQLLRPEAAALKAILAGADIVMLTWSIEDQSRAFRHVIKAVRSGELRTSELDTKVHRILTAKAFANIYKRDPNQLPLMRGRQLSSQSYTNTEASILDQNLRASLLPRKLPEKGDSSRRAPASIARVCVLAPARAFVHSFRKSVRTPIESKVIDGSMTSERLSAWIKSKRCSLTVAGISGRKTAALFQSLSKTEKEQTLIVNLGAPSLIPIERDFLKVLHLYFNHADSGKKIAQHLEEILRDLNFKTASN